MSDNTLETLNPDEVQSALQQAWDAAYQEGDEPTCELLAQAIDYITKSKQVIVVEVLKQTELYSVLTKYKADNDKLRHSHEAAYEEGYQAGIKSMQAAEVPPVQPFHINRRWLSDSSAERH